MQGCNKYTLHIVSKNSTWEFWSHFWVCLFPQESCSPVYNNIFLYYSITRLLTCSIAYVPRYRTSFEICYKVKSNPLNTSVLITIQMFPKRNMIIVLLISSMKVQSCKLILWCSFRMFSYFMQVFEFAHHCRFVYTRSFEHTELAW